MPSPNNKIRNWVFTLNNPEGVHDEATRDAWLEARFACEKPEVKYIIANLERGEEGTLHLQGYVIFKSSQRLSACKKFIPRAHWEVRRGIHQQAKEYCQKAETAVCPYNELGTEPVGRGHRSDLASVGDLVKAGATDLAIFEEHPGAYMRYFKGIAQARTLQQRWPRDGSKDRRVLWFYGGTGTGKTRQAAALSTEDTYWKPPESKWFDGYDGHKTVIFDDFRKNWCTFSYLLRLADRYPLIVQKKGGSYEWLAETIIITAPMPPWEVYSTREDVGQLLRRIDEVRHFTDDGPVEGTLTEPSEADVSSAPAFNIPDALDSIWD